MIGAEARDARSFGIEVSCKCGWEALVEEPEGGQSLAGTAGYRLARHEQSCDDCSRSLSKPKRGKSVPTSLELVALGRGEAQ